MDQAQVSLPENARLKFLMPSRRHHPQVEPLLATYNICYSKKVAKTFWAFKEQISLLKIVGSWRLWKASCLCPKYSFLFPFNTYKFCWFHEKILLRNHHFPPSQTFIFSPFFSKKTPFVFMISFLPLMKITSIRLKTHSLDLPKPLKSIENSEKFH